MYKKIQFKKFSDGRGDLLPLEFGKTFPNADIPFEVKRCFFISEPTYTTVRGKHAHKNLEQVVVAINGSFTLDLDNGKGQKESLLLNDRSIGIHIEDLVWGELKNFSEDCVVIVLASDHYDADDYIHDYDAFIETVQKNIHKN